MQEIESTQIILICTNKMAVCTWYLILYKNRDDNYINIEWWQRNETWEIYFMILINLKASDEYVLKKMKKENRERTGSHVRHLLKKQPSSLEMACIYS